MKKTPPGIHPMNMCTKFQPYPMIFTFPSAPGRFWAHLGGFRAHNCPENQNFQKMKKPAPGIHPRNKCTKFQPNPTIFRLSRLPQSFSAYGQTDRQTDRQTNRQTHTHCLILAQLKLRTNKRAIFQVYSYHLSKT